MFIFCLRFWNSDLVMMYLQWMSSSESSRLWFKEKDKKRIVRYRLGSVCDYVSVAPKHGLNCNYKKKGKREEGGAAGRGRRQNNEKGNIKRIKIKKKSYKYRRRAAHSMGIRPLWSCFSPRGLLRLLKHQGDGRDGQLIAKPSCEAKSSRREENEQEAHVWLSPLAQTQAPFRVTSPLNSSALTVRLRCPWSYRPAWRQLQLARLWYGARREPARPDDARLRVSEGPFLKFQDN
ncbi:hypothetical protein VUR80DRAFT_8395 [Thermomyces stellatus]